MAVRKAGAAEGAVGVVPDWRRKKPGRFWKNPGSAVGTGETPGVASGVACDRGDGAAPRTDGVALMRGVELGLGVTRGVG